MSLGINHNRIEDKATARISTTYKIIGFSYIAKLGSSECRDHKFWVSRQLDHYDLSTLLGKVHWLAVEADFYASRIADP